MASAVDKDEAGRNVSGDSSLHTHFVLFSFFTYVTIVKDASFYASALRTHLRTHSAAKKSKTNETSVAICMRSWWWFLSLFFKGMDVTVRGLELVWRQSFMQSGSAGDWESFWIMFVTLSSDIIVGHYQTVFG